MGVDFTKEEAEAVITQLGARIDYLKGLIVGESKNYKRVVELVTMITILESAQMKVMGMKK